MFGVFEVFGDDGVNSPRIKSLSYLLLYQRLHQQQLYRPNARHAMQTEESNFCREQFPEGSQS